MRGRRYFAITTAIVLGVFVFGFSTKSGVFFSPYEGHDPELDQSWHPTKIKDRDEKGGEASPIKHLETARDAKHSYQQPEPESPSFTNSDDFLDPDVPPEYEPNGRTLDIGRPIDPDDPEADLASLMREPVDIGPPLEP